jgi:vesicle-associated membrane protein 7
MTILYSLVTRGKVVLAEYTTTSGNFPTITRVLLGKLSNAEGKMSYVYDQYVFHYIVEKHIMYMCMCDDMERRRVPFAFLEDIKERFSSRYGDQAQTAHAFAMSDEFGGVLRSQMAHYNNPGNDHINSVSSKIDDVKNVMVQNIEMILERGEKLELMVDKTDRLQQQAFKFERSSNQLRVTMFYRKMRIYLLFAFIIALFLWLISSVICGFDYEKCKSR